MERASPRSFGVAALAATLAAMRDIPFMDDLSPAFIMQRKRGKAPKGKRWRSSSVYWPAGVHKNVQDMRVKNPKQAANIQMMHEKWWNAKKEREHKNSACV